MAKRRLKLTLMRGHALEATRVSIGQSKLVYLLIADKRLKYDDGKSRIAYIGTTKKGTARLTQSVAARADDIFGHWGVYSFRVRVVTCRPRQKVKTWIKLERALLIKFREKYGQVPHCNSHGEKMKRTDEFAYFAEDGVLHVIEELS